MQKIIDSRERFMIPLLPEFKISTLKAGDFIIGKYIIERKTWIDYYNSINDSRIFNMYKMANFVKENPDFKIVLLLEGKPNSDSIKKKVENHINLFMSKFDAEVIKTTTIEESAEYIRSLEFKDMSYATYAITQVVNLFSYLCFGNNNQKQPISEPIQDDINIKLLKTWNSFGVEPNENDKLIDYINENNPEYIIGMKILKHINGISEHTAFQLLSTYELKYIIENKDVILAYEMSRLTNIKQKYFLSEKKYSSILDFINHPIKLN